MYSIREYSEENKREFGQNTYPRFKNTIYVYSSARTLGPHSEQNEAGSSSPSRTAATQGSGNAASKGSAGAAAAAVHEKLAHSGGGSLSNVLGGWGWGRQQRSGSADNIIAAAATSGAAPGASGTTQFDRAGTQPSPYNSIRMRLFLLISGSGVLLFFMFTLSRSFTSSISFF